MTRLHQQLRYRPSAVTQYSGQRRAHFDGAAENGRSLCFLPAASHCLSLQKKGL
jgi:hypothetical protein